MADQQHNPAAVRVCAIADIECSRGCGTGACKREAESLQPAAAPIHPDVLAHIKWLHYCLREAGHCIDGGTCHHECGPKGECWRQDGSVPLTGSRLTDDWKLPAPSAPLEGTGNGANDRALRYAQGLATGLWAKHWRDSAPQWKVLDDTLGVLTQIDNMVCELSRAPRTEVAGAVPYGWKLMPPKMTLAMRMAFAEAAAEYMKRTGGNNPDVMYEAAFAAAPQPPSADAAAAPEDERAAFEKEIGQLIDERDSFEHMGTVLAKKVSELFEIDVGEWSSANNPILCAIHIVEDQIARAAAPQPAAAAGQEAVVWIARNGVSIEAFFRSKGAAESYAAEMQKSHDLSGSLAAFTVEPLYTTPPAQVATRQGLTDEQILEQTTRRVPPREVPKVPEFAFSKSQFLDVVRALLDGDKR
ncbi:hypothetical protein P4G95_08955 [Burkholderia vietnamiensis]|uniref:hypothetical protein n=1 Tax=Burkholderia vietnamiensis TaxID=60552 RepID=UPI0015945AB3|nr:hypothetical protein [Burkholderia vietnamiensis]WHU91006.1 hypothetical protein P4G95_08955 [Burkholderia vietnamiensis]